MVVGAGFPATLPKFCVAVSYYTRPSDPKVPVTLKIFLPGEEDSPAIAEELKIPDWDRLQKEDPPEGFDDPLIPVPVQVVFSPLVLKEPGAILVRAYAGEKEIKLGALRVLAPSAPSSV
jgi:hypothetical protein